MAQPRPLAEPDGLEAKRRRLLPAAPDPPRAHFAQDSPSASAPLTSAQSDGDTSDGDAGDATSADEPGAEHDDALMDELWEELQEN